MLKDLIFALTGCAMTPAHVRTHRAARAIIKGITEAEVRHSLHQFSALWDELFPAEQARIVTSLVKRIDVDGLTSPLTPTG